MVLYHAYCMITAEAHLRKSADEYNEKLRLHKIAENESKLKHCKKYCDRNNYNEILCLPASSEL